MTGETDLATILRNLRVSRRPDPVTVVAVEEPVTLGDGVGAVLAEHEATTAVVTVAEAERRGWPIGFVAAWLTVELHTSLEAVGLTAVLAAALADRQISCNVLAGYHHDHLLVPVERAEEAIAVIEALRSDTDA